MIMHFRGTIKITALKLSPCEISKVDKKNYLFYYILLACDILEENIHNV